MPKKTATDYQGYLQIYTGNGKGKTTCALGLAVRALGRGLKPVIVYFDKGGDNYSERAVLDRLQIPYHVTGLNRINERGIFRFGVLPEDIAEGKRGLQIFADLLEQNYDLIVLDEICSNLNLGIVPPNDFYPLLDQWNHRCELVCTGRGAPRKLLLRADLVTEMRLKKHYFYQGVPARAGIEF